MYTADQRGALAIDGQVDTVLGSVAAAFRMDQEEAERFREKSIARLIAALPFLAGSAHPVRTATQHVGIYVLSVRETRNSFYATEADDRYVYARLGPISSFEGGDERIIRRGMALLALNMVNDYARDVSLDRMLGKHNPVASGAWNYEAIVRELQRHIEVVDCPHMDDIMASDEGADGYWEW